MGAVDFHVVLIRSGLRGNYRRSATSPLLSSRLGAVTGKGKSRAALAATGDASVMEPMELSAKASAAVK